jgi:hypothetical protein
MPDDKHVPKCPSRISGSSAAQREATALRRAKQSAEAAEWDAKSEHAQKVSDEWRRRWSLSLAIANSGGLLGIATVILDHQKRPVGWEILLLPSAWCFMFGLVAAGAIPLLKSLAHRHEKDWAWVVARERQEGGPTTIFMGSDEPEWSEDWRVRFRHRQKALEKTIGRFETFSGTIFALGLFISAGPALKPNHRLVRPDLTSSFCNALSFLGGSPMLDRARGRYLNCVLYSRVRATGNP